MVAPRNGGGGFLLLEEGGTVAPHISFSLAREKETCRARYKEKERWERLFVTKAAPFSFVLYILKTDSLVLCGLVLPLAPLTGAGIRMTVLRNRTL